MRIQMTMCFVAVLLISSACSVEILHDLDEGQANQVLAALSREGVAARKEQSSGVGKSSYAVTVPRASAPQAWRVLRQQNLPRSAHKGLGEVFGKVGLIPTATQEQAMMRQAMAGELGRTLERLGGVLEARVHVVVPRRDRFNRDTARSPRASVLLKADSSCSATEAQVKRLVAGGVDDLKPEAVSVVIDRSGAKPQAAGQVAMAKVGPFLVDGESRGPLIAVLVVGVLLVVGLGLALVLLLRRRRQPAVAHLPVEATATRDAFVSQMSAMTSGSLVSPEQGVHTDLRSRRG